MLNKRVKISIFAAVLLIAASFLIKPDYYLVLPGTVQDLQELVQVDNAQAENEGAFFLVTISQQRANLPLFVYALVHPSVDLVPRTRVIPPEMDRQEYNELMRLWMEESQVLAKTVALRWAGHEVPVESDGVVIREVLKDSPAVNILQAADIIKAIDGTEVHITEELIDIIQKRRQGDFVEVIFYREGTKHTENIKTASHPVDEDKAALRILVQTLNWEPQLPVEINIDAGKITGPSAGMMFVLEIFNQLEPEDITRGRKIAGTGTVNLNGEIGPIGGVKQKVIAAENGGAEIFLVPTKNFPEAQETARKIEVVEVNTLQEVFDFLMKQ